MTVRIPHVIFNLVPYYTYLDLQNKPLETLANFGVTVDALRRVDTDHDGILTPSDNIRIIGPVPFATPQNPDMVTIPPLDPLPDGTFDMNNPRTISADLQAESQSIMINIADYEAFLNVGGGNRFVQPQAGAGGQPQEQAQNNAQPPAAGDTGQAAGGIQAEEAQINNTSQVGGQDNDADPQQQTSTAGGTSTVTGNTVGTSSAGDTAETTQTDIDALGATVRKWFEYLILSILLTG